MNDHRDDCEQGRLACHVADLVRAHLDRQAASVDASAFMARVRRAGAARRADAAPRADAARRRRIRVAFAAAAIAAGIAIAVSAAHLRPAVVKVPPVSEIAKVVQPPRDAVVSGALTGLSATGRCLARAAEAGSLLPAAPPSLPALDDKTIGDLRSDADQLKHNLRQILDQALADAGLKS